MQAGIADLAELAEYLEVGAGLGQHAAGLEKQLVQVTVDAHAFGFQGLGHRRIATAFVDAVFLVDVYRLDRQLPTQLAEHGGRLVPGRGRADQQGNIQCAEGLAQVLQVAQPEVDLARCVVVGQPLLRGNQVYGRHRAALARSEQGGVVMQAQVGAQPDQMHLKKSTLDQYLVSRQWVFGDEQFRDFAGQYRQLGLVDAYGWPDDQLWASDAAQKFGEYRQMERLT